MNSIRKVLFGDVSEQFFDTYTLHARWPDALGCFTVTGVLLLFQLGHFVALVEANT
jgi:hypothetical protein